MPTKSDRILSYLPGTFKRQPQKSALFAIVDTFGRELLQAENSLAAIMQAHWVDHADRGTDVIDDLARIASLYGLAPRCDTADDETQLCALPPGCDETVEEFREHLKRYVRTFLEGTVTVQGILRVTAEALELRIANAYEEMDTWWNRNDDMLVTRRLRGDDAAARLFGFAAAAVSGSPVTSAQVRGSVDLSGGVDLSETPILRLRVDDIGPVDIDLTPESAEPIVDLASITKTINTEMGGNQIAGHDGRHLTLSSIVTGPSSRIEVLDGPQDAATHILGLAPRVYAGSEARAASVTGAVDLSNGVDLSHERYIRLAIDRTQVYEIEFASNAEATLDQIMAAINNAVGEPIASHDGHSLTLTSPTTGFNSSIGFEQPAAQDATLRLFGDVGAFHLGQDAQPARVTGTRNLNGGVDLNTHSYIEISLDGNPARTINCAGADPANTRPSEIAAAINAAFGETVARQDGRFITLNSPTAGPDGTIVFETLDQNDATELIFGIGPRTFTGNEATAARLTGTVDLSADPQRTNLMAQHQLLLGIDGCSPIEVDLRTAAGSSAAVTLSEIVKAINDAVDDAVASHDNHFLTLVSPTMGSASRLEIIPAEETMTRRFVTRAMIIDEAAQAVLGCVSRQAEGVPATAARIVGQKDLSRGVDLRDNRFLRLSVDNGPFVDIDCAGPRPRATLPDEIVGQINARFGSVIASHNGKNLILASSTMGDNSRIAFAPPQATDALATLLGVAPGTVRGLSATGVRLTGTVDLSEGINLEAGAAIKIGLGSAEPETITLTEEAAQLSLTRLANVINAVLGSNVTSHDGAHLIITSPQRGEDSRLVIEAAGETDVTEAIFGFAPSRTYRGNAATPAQIIGTTDLSGTVDLSVARFLVLGVDGETAVPVDCTANADDATAVTLGQIIDAINAQVPSEPATPDGSHLVLKSPTTGTTSQLMLGVHIGGDARNRLFGSVPNETIGDAPAPAMITGEVDLLTPVDLSERPLLRLVVDNRRPVEIDIAGAAPTTTFLDEVVGAINAVFPGLAVATDDDRLQLTSPTSDAGSQLAVQPLRYLELLEYPPQPEILLPLAVRHGQHWSVVNAGAAGTVATVTFSNPRGVTGPALINRALNWQIRLLATFAPGETVHLWRDPQHGLQAIVTPPTADESRTIPAHKILVGPLGAQAIIPYADPWTLTGNQTQPATLQLNNPTTPMLVILRARLSGAAGHNIQVTVTASAPGATELPDVASGAEARLVGRLRRQDEGWYLVDADDTTLAHLRAKAGVNLAAYHDCVVAVTGLFYPSEDPSLLVVQTAACLFDVMLRWEPADGEPVEETYPGVTIGVSTGREDALVRQINAGEDRSQLVTAEQLPKDTVLYLPRGRSDWVYLDCLSARFNEANFNEAAFAGGPCLEPGIFNISRFANTRSPEPVTAVFATKEPVTGPPTDIVFAWTVYQPGAFQVNLPVDLPPRFGGRFNQARFGQGPQTQELYTKIVTEPSDDDNFLVTLINHNPHSLVQATVVPLVPLGWEAIQMPFRRAQFLTLGSQDEPARLYLSEEGLDGFIELRAREPGSWGNEIAVSARPSGPAMYDVCVVYEGGRFENARKAVEGTPPPALTQKMLEASSIGVLQAKAAGVQAEVTREPAD